ncbi:hypothetical protein LWI29_005606 [Acer saccharum]|uniref:Uncharacterized protein n=1 Tax=Acer saccharum TaxID=4024 RepID=A0AA39SFV0_ACESA|nr:hypothetical protein LWI29_005606 [Acer saccharum]
MEYWGRNGDENKNIENINLMFSGFFSIRLNSSEINKLYKTVVSEILDNIVEGVTRNDLFVRQSVKFANTMVIRPMNFWIARTHPLKQSNLIVELGFWHIFITYSLRLISHRTTDAATLAVEYMEGQDKISARHAAWSAYLQQFTFVLKHKAGNSNRVADALSRRSSLLSTMSVTIPGFDLFRDLLVTDPYFATVMAALQAGEKSDFLLVDGFLFRAQNLPENSSGGRKQIGGKQNSQTRELQHLEPNTKLMRNDSVTNALKDKTPSEDKTSGVTFSAKKRKVVQMPRAVIVKEKKRIQNCLSVGQTKVDQAVVLGPTDELGQVSNSYKVQALVSQMVVDLPTVIGPTEDPIQVSEMHMDQSNVLSLGKREIQEGEVGNQSEGKKVKISSKINQARHDTIEGVSLDGNQSQNEVLQGVPQLGSVTSSEVSVLVFKSLPVDRSLSIRRVQ